jgi:glycine hydroxymethyltransferase
LQREILNNAVTLSTELEKKGYRIVAGGTDTHQVLVDVSSKDLNGKICEETLESVSIVVNRNVIPSDANRPGTISGIRLGTTAVTARGMGTNEICEIASLIDRALMNRQD